MVRFGLFGPSGSQSPVGSPSVSSPGSPPLSPGSRSSFPCGARPLSPPRPLALSPPRPLSIVSPLFIAGPRPVPPRASRPVANSSRRRFGLDSPPMSPSSSSSSDYASPRSLDSPSQQLHLSFLPQNSVEPQALGQSDPLSAAPPSLPLDITDALSFEQDRNNTLCGDNITLSTRDISMHVAVPHSARANYHEVIASTEPITCEFQHNASAFRCILCDASFPAWAGLKIHRHSAHSGVLFEDLFTASCDCGIYFTTRLAALNHSNACLPTQPPSKQIPPLRDTAIVRSLHSVWSSDNINSSSRVATPQLASRTAASVDTDAPNSLVFNSSTLKPPARPVQLRLRSTVTVPISCPTCTRTFSSRRSLAAHAYRCSSPPRGATPRRGPPAVASTVQAATPQLPSYILRFDGSCLRNGNTPLETACGAGAVLLSPDGHTIWSLSAHLPPPVTTNNTAEYKALLAGLVAVLHWKPPRLTIEGDSQLILDQIRGRARCKHVTLRPLRTQAISLLRRFREHGVSYSLKHIERTYNSLADGLAKDGASHCRTTCICACLDPSLDCVPLALRSQTASISPAASLWSVATECFALRHPPSMPAHLSQDAQSIHALIARSNDTVLQEAAEMTDAPAVDESAALPCTFPTIALPPITLDTPMQHVQTAIEQPLAAQSTEAFSTPPLSVVDVNPVPPPLIPETAPAHEAVPPIATASAGACIDQEEFTTTLITNDAMISPVPSPPPTTTTAQNDDVDMSPTAPRCIQPPLIASHDGAGSISHVTCRKTPRRLRNPPCVPWWRLGRRHWRTTTTGTQRHAYSANSPYDSPTSSVPSPRLRRARRASVIHALLRQHRMATIPCATVALNTRGSSDAWTMLSMTSTAWSTPSTSRNRVEHARRRVSRLKRAKARLDLRHLFNSSESKCVEQILRAGSATSSREQCEIPLSQLYDHFHRVNRPEREFDYNAEHGQAFGNILSALPPATFMAHVFTDDITSDEIETALDRCRLEPAPGLDGIPYRSSIVIASWSCRSCWKVSVTELIYKKGDAMDPANWRPLALQSTLYKLFATIIKTRFSTWMECNERLNNAQKGFHAFNGCHEHNFLERSVMDSTRRKAKPLYAVWYDIKNAFGSIPHAYLWRVLSGLGIPDSFVALVRDIYSNASTVVSTREGATPPLEQRCGVFQGCPLSPLLFIAGMTPLIEALQAMSTECGVELSRGTCTSVTAFADDLKIYSRTPQGITRLHTLVADFLSWTTMTANPSKCALLAVDFVNRSHVQAPMDLSLDGLPIPRLSWNDAYTYLGVREGFQHTHVRFQLTDKLRSLRHEAIALINSGLSPRQIFKALKVYTLSQLDYALRHVRATKSELVSFTTFLYRSLRHLLRLPAHSCNDFFASPPSCGGLGFLPLDEHRDAIVLAHGYQMLHSIDPTIQALARHQLREIIASRYIIDQRDMEDCGDALSQHYLNGTMDTLPFVLPRRTHSDISYMWTDITRSLQRFKLKFQSSNGEHFQLTVPHLDKQLSPKTVARHIKTHVKLMHADAWESYRDQGRTVNLHGDIGSKFITSHIDMRDSVFRFGIAARLNLIETRSVLKRQRVTGNDRCRHCGSRMPETLSDVLQSCPHNDGPIRYRHDSSLRVLTRAIMRANPDSVLRINSSVPGFPGELLKPDILLTNEGKKEVVICDLAVSYEDDQRIDGKTIFERKAETKTSRYLPLSRYMTQQGYSVYSCALVYRSLGSVAPANLDILCRLFNVPKSSANRLEAILSAQHVELSRAVWRFHCSGQSKFTRMGREVEPEEP
ncbi:hypothetical protein AeMF1_019933 [Aphanomyces euteiches]|nr:hypothetical protein AeMF1_019933 [Aphanomyces euteiches]